MLLPDQPKVGNTADVVVFQDLLKQGWSIHVYENKAVLTKEINKSIVIYDVFSVLKK